MRLTNIIAMKDIIILEKTRIRILLKGPVDATTPVERAGALSPVNLAERYR